MVRPGIDQAPSRAGIAPQHIPEPVDRDGGEGLLLRQHVIERAADLAKVGRGEVGLSPHRSKAGGYQQGIVLAQRHVKRRASRITMSRLGDARPNSMTQIALRDFRAPGKIEQRQAACRRHRRRLDAKPRGRDMSTCQNSQTRGPAGCHRPARRDTGKREWARGIGVAIALVSSFLGGTAAASTAIWLAMPTRSRLPFCDGA